MEEEAKGTEEKKIKINPTSLGIAVVIIALLALGGYLLLGKGKKTASQSLNLPTLIPTPMKSPSENPEGMMDNNEATESASMDFSKYKGTTDLIVEDTKVGTGQEIKDGDTAVVHYTGYLTNGTKFDSSVDRGAPFAFKLGAGEVITGWDKGVLGMKVNGVRRLIIPPNMGYGPRDVGEIPANSILIFDVELLKIE